MTYQGATYDGAGNQKAIGGYTFAYDAENRMTSSTVNSSTTTYVYDGNGNRVSKTMAGATTTYVYDAMGQLIAEYGAPTDSGTKYITVDHLGSTRLVTDTAQNQEICYDYLPFGEQIPSTTDGRTGCYGSSATPLTQKFTGKEREGTEANNEDFFQARYFSAFQQRFTRADPGNAGAHIRAPETWNAYAYVSNSPVGSIDPSGLVTCTLEGGEIPCGIVAQMHGAVVGCPNNTCEGWGTDANGKIAYYRFAAYANGTGGYQQATPAVSDPSAPENQIYRAFLLAAKYGENPIDPNASMLVTVRYVGSTYNIQIPFNDLNRDQASQDGFKDPTTLFHEGNRSYYLGALNLGTIDAGHVVQDPNGIEAHYDNFGPYNPLHWLFEALPSQVFNTRAEANTQGSNTRSTWVCSINLGCF